MMHRNIAGIIFLLLLNALPSRAQHDRVDSTKTVYEEQKNIPDSKFWGNSWHTSAAFNWSNSIELEASVGRTYGKHVQGESLSMFTMKSWGLGYGLAHGEDGLNRHMLKAFTERCAVSLPPLCVGVRGEYIFNMTDGKHYLRPAIGASFMYFDFFYNYSFLLNTAGNENEFKSGLCFRFKYYIGQKNWQTIQYRHR